MEQKITLFIFCPFPLPYLMVIIEQMSRDRVPCHTSTAPAVNVKESEKAYTMELAAPGIKKEYCRVAINDEGNLTIAIAKTADPKRDDTHHRNLQRMFSNKNTY